jgi:hypothetical protein
MPFSADPSGGLPGLSWRGLVGTSLRRDRGEYGASMAAMAGMVVDAEREREPGVILVLSGAIGMIKSMNDEQKSMGWLGAGNVTLRSSSNTSLAEK